MKTENWLLRKFWLFLPRPIKQWLKATAVIFGFLAILAPFSPRYAIGLAWSLIYAEGGIGWWLDMGFPLWSPILIAISTGTITTCGWVWIAYHEETPEFFKKFWKWSPPEKRLESFAYRSAQKVPYLAVPVISWFPDGGTWLGIAICIFLRLEKTVTLAIVTLGNVGKMISWGLGLSFAPEGTSSQIAIALMLVFLGTGLYRKRRTVIAQLKEWRRSRQ